MSLAVTATLVAGGELRVEGRLHAMRPGGSFAITFGREWLDDQALGAFLTTSISLSATFAHTEDTFHRTALYAATDFSFAMAVGKTFWNTFSPYLGARVFGGPIWWTAQPRAIPGQDPDHHAISIGSVVTLPRNLELAVDWAPVGARTVTAQAAINF